MVRYLGGQQQLQDCAGDYNSVPYLSSIRCPGSGVQLVLSHQQPAHFLTQIMGRSLRKKVK